MQTTITPTHLVDTATKECIMQSAPEKWLGIKQDLTNTLTQDLRVQFAQENNSAYLHDETGNIVSYCAFGNQGTFFEKFTKSIQHPYQNPAVLIYLFTHASEQKKGYAKQLFEDVVATCKAEGNDALLFSTGSDDLQKMYQKRGAFPLKAISPPSSFLILESINNDHFLAYPLV